MSKRVIVVLVVLLVFASGFGNFANLALKNEQAKVENTFAAEQVPQIGAQTSDEVIIIKMTIGNSTIYVNSQPNSIDVPPTIIESRTLLPIRWVAEPLGATVNWESTTKKVTITLNNTTIALWIGNNTAKVNGMSKQIDPGNPKVVPLIINGRTMLPIRFISENLGCQVDWDSYTRTVTITYQLPLSETSASKTVTPEQGGVVELADGTKVAVPQGAVNGTTTLTIKKTSYDSSTVPVALSTAGYGVYDVSAGNSSLTSKVKITLPIKSKGTIDPEIFYWNGYFWESVGGTIEGNTITCETDHLSLWAVLFPSSLADGNVHLFTSSKVKGAYIGRGLALISDLNPLLDLLKGKNYNKLYINRGGITIKNNVIKADVPEPVPDDNLKAIKNYGIPTELVFGIGENTFEYITKKENNFNIPFPFDQKVNTYKNLFYQNVLDWINAHQHMYDSLGYRKVHLNLESGKTNDAEAATIALIDIFRSYGWSVSVSALNNWLIDNIKKMKNADSIILQLYNLTIKSEDDVRNKVDNFRQKIINAGVSTSQYVIAMPYYSIVPHEDFHPASENISLYVNALRKYKYLESLGGAYVYDFAYFNNNTSTPKGDNYYESKYDFDAFDNLYAQLPDLIVDSISLSPTSPKEGDSVTFTANIKNIGQADATNFNTKLYVGGNAIDTKNISTLAAGSSTSITFTNKWTATSGCQDVKVVVDSDNTVQESDENNNTLTKQICPEKKQDVIIDIWVDKGCGASYCLGGPIVISFKANQNGTAVILDKTPDGNTSTIGTYTLTANSTKSISGTITPPIGLETLVLQFTSSTGVYVEKQCSFNVVDCGVNFDIWVNKGCGSTYTLGEYIEIHAKSSISADATYTVQRPDGTYPSSVHLNANTDTILAYGNLSGPTGQRTYTLSFTYNGKTYSKSCSINVTVSGCELGIVKFQGIVKSIYEHYGLWEWDFEIDITEVLYESNKTITCCGRTLVSVQGGNLSNTYLGCTDGYIDNQIKVGDKVEVYGPTAWCLFCDPCSLCNSFCVNLCGADSYIKKVNPSNTGSCTALFDFEEGSGTTTRDEYSGYVGTLNGNVSWDSSNKEHDNYSLKFGGSQSDYVGTNIPVPDGNFYCEAWVYPTDLSGNYYRPVITNWTSSHGTFWLGFVGNKLNLQLGDVGGGPTTTISPNQWYKIGFYFIKNSGFDLYLNNQVVFSQTQIPASLSSSMTIRFGAYSYGNLASGFKGNIDTILICTDKPNILIKKPNIYLYPTQTTNVNVKIIQEENIIKSDPIYPKGGWNVTVTPEGKIDGSYDYLFYEANVPNLWNVDNGWLIERNELKEKLDYILTKLGLNKKEKDDFIYYWSVNLPESRYYVFSLLDEEKINEAMELKITPEPNTVRRIWFGVALLDKPIEIKEPITKPIERNGFTVVEWGLCFLDSNNIEFEKDFALP